MFPSCRANSQRSGGQPAGGDEVRELKERDHNVTRQKNRPENKGERRLTFSGLAGSRAVCLSMKTLQSIRKCGNTIVQLRDTFCSGSKVTALCRPGLGPPASTIWDRSSKFLRLSLARCAFSLASLRLFDGKGSAQGGQIDVTLSSSVPT